MKFVYKGKVEEFNHFTIAYRDIPIKPYRDIYCVKHNGAATYESGCCYECDMRYGIWITLEIVENNDEKENRILFLCHNFKPNEGLFY